MALGEETDGRIIWTISRSFGDGQEEEREKATLDNFAKKFASEENWKCVRDLRRKEISQANRG